MFNSRNRFKLRMYRNPAGENGDGGGGTSGENGGDPGATISQDPTGKSGVTDKEAQLIKEVMEKKNLLKAAQESNQALTEQLKAFNGIDPNEIRTLLQEKRDRETAELEKRGEFDRIRQQMVEDHNRQMEELRNSLGTKAASLEETLTKAQRDIHELTIGRQFGESNFIREKLTLTPSKARVIYGSHFELQGDRVVAFDKPAGAAERTILVDGTGTPLSFEKALEKIIEVDPDRDNLIRSQMKTGAGSSSEGGSKPSPQIGSGRDRIASALSSGALPFPKPV